MKHNNKYIKYKSKFMLKAANNPNNIKLIKLNK